MKRSLIALTAAATFASTGVFAEAHTQSAMGVGLTMFEALVQSELDNIGVEADVTTLTLGQLALIRNVLEGDGSTTDKQEEVEAIVNQQ
ncbi:hypothetical protein [Pontivivens ytuae]|uniref:Uncharacterized protein n=1 Tax=Pontivivens ytuae TaxID=2789856 RepID=A0A7S9LQR8_9RHOB|nr:hypothetical protein [Pontivivens ytuae]QPH53579.1 hypothetical protein I0K15_17630 [Pontivivens ytuae]